MNAFSSRGLAGALLLTIGAGISAQQAPATAGRSDTEAIAAAIVRSQSTAIDDPDALARDLLTTALAHRRSPAAWFPVQEVIWFVGQLQDPAALRAMLPAPDATERQHGRLAQKCIELRWWLDRATEGPAKRGFLPPLGYCKHALVVGPFSDGGDHFLGVPFAPEFRFPALGAEVPGRGRPAKCRRVATRPGSDYVDYIEPGITAPGCYYALHRFAVATPTDAFLETEFDGDWQLFVDGVEIERVERWRATSPRRHYPGVHLPAGEHTVLLKICSNERNVYTLRWLDADGALAASVQQIEITDPNAPIADAAKPIDTRYVTADDVFLRAAEQPDADPSLRIAGLLLAIRENDHDLALRLAEPLQKTPPADPATAIAFARVLRWAPLPDELRKATARKIEEAAIDALPATHHTALMTKTQLLDEQDKREQALRLLEKHPAPGPWTFARRHGLLRDLKFAAEEMPLLEQWAQKCPRDARPLLTMADAAMAAGDGKRAHDLRRRAWNLQHDLQGALSAAIRGAIDVGDLEQAQAWLDDLDPQPAGSTDFNRLQIEASLARARGDTKLYTERLQQMAVHSDPNDAALLDIAGQLTRLSQRDAAIACLRRSLARNPDQPVVRAWLANVGADTPEDAAFVRFRRDGDTARTAFTAGDREQAASATVLIDQRIVELRADGSWTSESHELRRINDQAGVEEYRTADAVSGADEVLLLRTIGTDGKAWVPGRVENAYAMQRLEPGAFVEWRYRERGKAPGADVAGAGQFLFGSETEPMVLSELVLIRPKDAPRGELRTRSLGEPTETVDLGDGRTALVFRRENVAALPRENFLPALQELVPVAEVGEDDAPFARLRRLRVAIGARTKVTAPIATQAQALVAGIAGERAIVETVHAWCQKEIEDGPADNALDTLLRKKGNRFLLEVALLRGAKFDVVTLACAETRPELNQAADALFLGEGPHNVPGAMVTLKNGERIHLFVDAPRYWPLGVVPAPRAGSRAVALFDDRAESIVLPGNPDAAQQTIRVRGNATIEGNELRIEVTGELADLAGFGLAERLRELKENQQKVAARQIAQQLFAGFRVKAASLADPSPGKPLSIQASLTRAVQAKGQGFVMPLPLSPINYVKNFGDRAERSLPYHFPGELASEWQIDVDPGKDLRFVECPAPVAVDLGSLSHELQCHRVGDKLRFVRHSRLAPVTLPASRFAEWLRVLADCDRADQVSVELVGKGS